MWWECFAELLFPRRCKVCGRVLFRGEKHLCMHCLDDMPLSYYWNWEGNPAEKILWGRTYLERVVPLFFYERRSPYAKLLHKIKYQGDTRLAQYLGRMLGDYLREAGLSFDFIIPVPLHPRKKWKRGYNQAEEIAKGVAMSLWGEEYEKKKRIRNDILCRRRFTDTQTKIAVGSKWKNVEGAFSLTHKAAESSFRQKLSGAEILLLDDVITTGATIEACHEALKIIKDVKITASSLAYVE